MLFHLLLTIENLVFICLLIKFDINNVAETASSLSWNSEIFSIRLFKTAFEQPRSFNV
jgi:hypothetical protein